MKKSQFSIEFIVLVAFMFLIFVFVAGVLTNRVVQVQQDQEEERAEQIALLIQREIDLAQSVPDGYHRTFQLPTRIDGYVYDVELIDDRELVIMYNDIEYVVFLRNNVLGNVSRGFNEISKREGIIFIQSVQAIPECDDELDNDGDLAVDLADAGCIDQLDTDESNCGDGICEGGETWFTCSQECPPPILMAFRGATQNMLTIYEDGSAELYGSLTESTTPTLSVNDEVIIVESAGSPVSILNLYTGDLELQGTVQENQSTLSPSGSDNFLITNSVSTLVAYFDDNGNLLLAGPFTALNLPPIPICPDAFCDTAENCPADSVSCQDNVCFVPTCTNGCGQTAVGAGLTDPGQCDATNGCAGQPCACDGAGNCVDTCPDGVCSLNENCPADAGACSLPPACNVPTCDDGCGQSPIGAGLSDPGRCDETTGCVGQPCLCDGAGTCIDTCPDGTCGGNETCAADNNACVDNVCYAPLCSNGCTEVAIADGVTDTGCDIGGGCAFPPCSCDGAGGCDPDSGQIYSHGFESGTDGWWIGGTDSFISGTRSQCDDSGNPGGSLSLQLQDDTVDSFAEKTFDFSTYTRVNVSWSAYFSGPQFQLGECLEVRCDGTTITTYCPVDQGTMDQWLDGQADGQFMTITNADCTFDNSVAIRFEAEFSGNNDNAHIDCIEIFTEE